MQAELVRCECSLYRNIPVPTHVAITPVTYNNATTETRKKKSGYTVSGPVLSMMQTSLLIIL